MLLDGRRHLHVPALLTQATYAVSNMLHVARSSVDHFPAPYTHGAGADLNDDLDSGCPGGHSRCYRRRSERVRPPALQSLLVCTKAAPVCRCEGAGLGNESAMLRARRSGQYKRFAGESCRENHRR